MDFRYPSSCRTTAAMLIVLVTVCCALLLGCAEDSDATVVDSGTCGTLSWVYNDEGDLSITGTGEMNFNEYSGQAPWSPYKESIVTVTIGNGVTSITTNAFKDCTSLRSISIPATTTSITTTAFEGCTALTSFTVSDGNSFYCSSDGILFTKSMDRIARYPAGKLSTSYAVPDGVRYIGNSSFDSCINLTSVVIPESMSPGYIGTNAFNGCTSLNSVTIPENVTSIGGAAFRGCTSLTSITIPEQVTTIANRTFYGCSSLRDVTIPENVTSIGFMAFYGCTSLTSITIPENVSSIDTDAFDNCSRLFEVINLSDLDIEKGSTDNGKVAWRVMNLFDSADKATVNILDGKYVYGVNEGITYLIHYIGNGTSEVLPNTINGNPYMFYRYAFSDSHLTTVTFPNNITRIGMYAFTNCTTLTSITIPDNVESIGSGAFSGCSALSSISIGKGLWTIERSAFEGCDALTTIINNSFIMIAKGSVDNGYIGYHATTITGDVSSTNISGISVIYNTHTRECTIYNYSGNEPVLNLSSLEIESADYTVVGLRYHCFYNKTSLFSVTIGDGVRDIGWGAFEGCTSLFEVINLSDLDIEKGSTDHGYVAYYAKNVFQSADDATIGILDDKFVYGISGDDTYLIGYIVSDNSVILPYNIDGQPYIIYRDVFKNKWIDRLTISDNIKSIEEGAFGELEFYDVDGTTRLDVTADNLKGSIFSGNMNKLVKQIPDDEDTPESSENNNLSPILAIIVGVISVGVIVFVAWRY